MSPQLLGVGTALPQATMNQSIAAELAVDCCTTTPRQADVLRSLFRRTSVVRRGLALLTKNDDADELRRFFPRAADCTDTRGGLGPTTGERMAQFARLAPPLARTAGARALDDAALGASDVTHLVTVSCTGFAAPGVEHHLIESLGLPRDVRRLSVGFMGCHGALNGLQAAATIVGADPTARVLLCAVELCSLHFQYGWHPERLVGNALFADGAAAIVLGRGDGAPRWTLRATASRLIEDCEREMKWIVGDHGFVMTLLRRVPATLALHLRPWIDDWLARHDLTVDQVGSWAIHAGGPRIVQAVSERLALAPDASHTAREVLRTCGNMSSATILFILERLRRDRAPLPCVALGFGPGLVAEAALIVEE